MIKLRKFCIFHSTFIINPKAHAGCSGYITAKWLRNITKSLPTGTPKYFDKIEGNRPFKFPDHFDNLFLYFN